jgi:septal ring factor EnvC (AmiA/AmiB activator)
VIRFGGFGRFGRFGRFGGFGGFVGFALVISATLHAQTPADDARAMSARAAARIRALQQEADRLAAQARSVFGDLRKLEIERALRREELAAIEAELADVTAQSNAAADQVKALEAKRVAATPGVANRLVEIAKRGRGGYVKLLLASDDVRAFGRLSRGVAAVAELDRVRLETHRRTLAAERDALAALDRQRQSVAAAQKAAAKARAAVDAAVSARNRLIDELDRRRDLTAEYVGELQAAQSALEQTIAGAGDSPANMALPIRPFRGDLEWPVAGSIVSLFGRAPADRFGTSIVRNGIELAAKEGAPVRAVHEGTVAFAAPFTSFGTLVIVDHGASAFTLYGHLSEAVVAQGARVKRGDQLGTVGLVPVGDAGLYFELRIDGRPVDPVQWLRSSR